MKVFQTRLPIILILSFSLLGGSIFIPNSLAQNSQIPDWIKNVAGWWANDEISENEFLQSIEYMINNNIISIGFVPCFAPQSQTYSSLVTIPSWIKNNANWWSENLIDDIDFTNGIEYLIEHRIIKIDNKKILSDIPVDDVTISSHWVIDKNGLSFVQSTFFEVYGVYGDCNVSATGNLVWNSLLLGLNPNKIDLYNEVAVWDDPQKSVVVFPFFTSVAYSEQGFYDYYKGKCDTCTTTKFKPPVPIYTSSGLGHQALSLLGYTSITDMDIDRNPSILKQFDKVIILHNEYVTRAMFDAITSHPNVIYLYPNALYAEIEVNYVDETITLIRGHNYPDPEITNGFDWEFDNTHPYEYDNQCLNMEFYKIKNGWMTNCYPENVFLNDGDQVFTLLKTIKEL